MKLLNNKNFNRLPLVFLLLKLYKILKESFFVYIFFLSIFNLLNFTYIKSYVIVLFILVFRILNAFFYWISFRYKISHLGIEIKKGIINTSSNYISIEKIKEVNEHKTLLYRLINGSMIYIYTDEQGKDGKVKLDYVSSVEAQRIKKVLNKDENLEWSDEKSYTYISSRKDMLISSISPISILMFTLFLQSILENLDKYLHLKLPLQSYNEILKNNIILISIFILLYFIISCLYIYIRTYMRFGEYKLSHNQKEIFIEKGFVNKSNLILSKDRIQALVIKWSLIHKIFGIMKIEVITSNDENDDENNLKSNLLVPFIHKRHISSLLSELLPDFDINIKLCKLHKITLINKILVPTAFLTLIYLVIDKFLKSFELIYIVFALLVILGKFLEGLFSKYYFNSRCIYYKKSNLITTLTIIPTYRIEEYRLNQNYIQRQLGLFSYEFIIREGPFKRLKILNIPLKNNHSHIQKMLKIFK